MNRLTCIFACAALAVLPALAHAQTRGEVTNLPLPRFVSIKSNEANARRGPSLSHRIDWVYTQKNLPVEIYGEYENWRRVRDFDGAGGWIHYSLLSGVRTVLITIDQQPIYRKPDDTSPMVAIISQNVIADLEECTIDWCQIEADGHKGWAPKSAMWGVYPNEIRE